jgi:hypothetical protein
MEPELEPPGAGQSHLATLTLASALFPAMIWVNASEPVETWSPQNIGSPALAGSASYNEATDTFTLQGAGADIWGSSDSFFYLHQPLVDFPHQMILGNDRKDINRSYYQLPLRHILSISHVLAPVKNLEFKRKVRR